MTANITSFSLFHLLIFVEKKRPETFYKLNKKMEMKFGRSVTSFGAIWRLLEKFVWRRDLNRCWTCEQVSQGQTDIKDRLTKSNIDLFFHVKHSLNEKSLIEQSRFYHKLQKYKWLLHHSQYSITILIKTIKKQSHSPNLRKRLMVLKYQKGTCRIN